MDEYREKPILLVEAQERERVARAVRAWLEGCPVKPVETLDAEYLGLGQQLSLSTVQAAHKTQQYVLGGYQAAYRFALRFRTYAATTGERLAADEALNTTAAWAEDRANYPDLGEGLRVRKVLADETARLTERYEDGTEDHQITITITYERN